MMPDVQDAIQEYKERIKDIRFKQKQLADKEREAFCKLLHVLNKQFPPCDPESLAEKAFRCFCNVPLMPTVD